jgi:hypothetical protein
VREHIRLEQTMFGHDFGVGPHITLPAVRKDTGTSTEPVTDGVRVNITTHIPLSKDFGSRFKKWSII